MKELNEESNVYDSEPKPASQWWTSTYLGEIEEDMLIHTAKGAHTHCRMLTVSRSGVTSSIKQEGCKKV